MGIQTNDSFNAVDLAASATVTAAGSGDEVRLPSSMQGLVATLDVTVAATAAGDILNAKVQTKVDGTNWLDIMHFPQVLGDGGAKRYVLKAVAAAAEGSFSTASALASATVRDLLGDTYRAVWSATDAGGAAQSFTFSLAVCPM